MRTKRFKIEQRITSAGAWVVLSASLGTLACGPSSRAGGTDAAGLVDTAGASDAPAAQLRFTFHNDIARGQAWVGLFRADHTPLVWRQATSQTTTFSEVEPGAYLLAAYRGALTGKSQNAVRIYYIDDVELGDNIFAGDRDAVPVRAFQFTLPPLPGASTYAVNTKCGSALVGGTTGSIDLICANGDVADVLVEATLDGVSHFLHAANTVLTSPVTLTGSWAPTPRWQATLEGLPVTPARASGSFHRNFLTRDFSMPNSVGNRITGELGVPLLNGAGASTVLTEFDLGPRARMSIREHDSLNGPYTLNVAPRLLPRIDAATWNGSAITWSETALAVAPDGVIGEVRWQQPNSDATFAMLAPYGAATRSLAMPPIPAPANQWLPTTGPSSYFIALTSVNQTIVELGNAGYASLRQYALDEEGYWYVPHGTSTFGPIDVP
jgi:hypothetical protein